MKLIRNLILSLVTMVAGSLTAADADGFVSIFNGKDFTGWDGPLENLCSTKF